MRVFRNYGHHINTLPSFPGHLLQRNDCPQSTTPNTNYRQTYQASPRHLTRRWLTPRSEQGRNKRSCLSLLKSCCSRFSRPFMKIELETYVPLPKLSVFYSQCVSVFGMSSVRVPFSGVKSALVCTLSMSTSDLHEAKRPDCLSKTPWT